MLTSFEIHSTTLFCKLASHFSDPMCPIAGHWLYHVSLNQRQWEICIVYHRVKHTRHSVGGVAWTSREAFIRMVASGSIKLRVVHNGIIYWVLCFSTGNQPCLISTHFHLEGKRDLHKVQGDLCLAMARDIMSFVSPSVKWVHKLRFLNHSGKSVVMSCAPVRQASWAMLITQTLPAVFPGECFYSRGSTHGTRRFMRARGRETQVCRRCEVCSNSSLAPSVSDYGEGGINTKTGNWRPLRFAIWWSLLVPDQLLGLSHGLVEQLPKRAAKPQFWYTGPDARKESESSRLT